MLEVWRTLSLLVVGYLLLCTSCTTCPCTVLPVLCELPSNSCNLALHWCSHEGNAVGTLSPAMDTKRSTYTNLLLLCCYLAVQCTTMTLSCGLNAVLTWCGADLSVISTVHQHCHVQLNHMPSPVHSIAVLTYVLHTGYHVQHN